MSETLRSQVDRLTQFVLAEIDGEPSQSQGAIDTAIRLLRERKRIYCPDCSDTVVVTKELREALEDEVGYQLEVATSMDDIDDAHLQGALDGILSTVFSGGVRVAKEVATVFRVGPDRILQRGDGNTRLLESIHDGDDIAILERRSDE